MNSQSTQFRTSMWLSLLPACPYNAGDRPKARLGTGSLGKMVRLVVLIAFLPLGTAVTFGQESATLSGTVKDPSGLAVTNVTVAVTNEKTNETKGSVTGSTGDYSFTALPVGSYTVRISAAGFASLEQQLSLSAGQAATLPLILSLATAEQSVSVSGQLDPYGVVPVEPTEAVFGLPQKLEDIPRSVSSVDSALLNLYSAKTVNDLVTVVPGAFTAAYFGVPGSVFLRGDIADNYFRGFRRVENRGNYGTPLSASDHIEIVKGPPSPIYGPGREGGFMNFYPKTARSEAAKWMEEGHGAVTAIYGQYDEKSGSGEYGMPFKLGSYRSGVYAFFEARDAHSFYKGIGDRYKLGQIAFDMELTPKLRLAYGFQGYHSEGTQNLGWNRVTQDLVDHQMYLAGSPAVNLSSDGTDIRPIDLQAGTLDQFSFQKNMGAVFPSFPYAKYYGLNPATVHLVKLPLNQIMVDSVDFSHATTYTAYFDAIYEIKPGVTLKNQSFYDTLDHQKFSSYGFGANYEPWSFENKSTLSFSWNPNSVVSMNAFTGFGFNRVQVTAGEERNDYQTVDRRDLSVGASPNDRFEGPYNSTPAISFQYYSTGSYRDLGLFWLSEVSFWKKLTFTTGARFDRYSPDFTGRFASEPLTHATATNNAGTYSASVSYRTPFHITPYFTAASSRFLDLGQGNELDATEIPTGAYIQPSSLYEGGVKTQDISGKFYASLAVFRQKRSSFNTQSQAIDYFQSKGMELETRGFLLKRVSVTGNLTWQDPEQLNAPFLLGIPPGLLGLTPQQAYGGRFIGFASIFPHTGSYPVAGQPHWVASPFGTVNITKNLGVLIGTTWVSSVTAGYVSNIKLPSYAIWRGSMFYRKGRYQVNFGVNNLFNATSFQSQYLFEDSLIKPGALRTVGGTMKYSF